jgi:tetratricopeptide (TPR) repeat protein
MRFTFWILPATVLVLGCGGGGDGKKTKIDIGASGQHLAAGLQKGRMKDYDGAIEEFTKAIEFHPGNILAYRNRGVARREKGDYKGALADYNAAVGLEPEDNEGRPITLAGRAVILVYLRQDAEALQDYNEAVRLRPDFRSNLDADMARARTNRGG